MNRMVFQVIFAFCLIFLNTAFAIGGSCGAHFENKCTCGIGYYETHDQYIVNCTNTGFQNTSVLQYMPLETEVLIFTGNNVPELPWNIFGAVNNYDKLKVIDMSYNNIRDIRGKTYHDVKNVVTLIINHNNLSISRYDDEVNRHHPRMFSNFINLESLHLTNAFSENTSAVLSEDLHDIFVNSNLTKLIKLHLEQNEISRFKDRQVFCDLPSLRHLHLGDNYLKEINFNVLCLKQLRFLDLQRNKFKNIRLQDLKILDKLEALYERNENRSLTVDFNLNPFVCDCRLEQFYNWMKTTKVDIRNKEYVICTRDMIYPEKIIDLNLEYCESHKNGFRPSSNGHNATLVFLLVVLSFILTGLVATLMYISRDRINRVVSTVFDSIYKKVQYTTIKDDECTEVHV